jgi:hypothetical protein
MNDVLKQISVNLGVTGYDDSSILIGIADYYGVNTAISNSLMGDILDAVGGNAATSNNYIQDIVIALGGPSTSNNWIEEWEAITAVPPSPPANTVLPVISGSTTLGSVLTTTNGTWTNAVSFTYQWKRGVTNIGTNSATYTLVIADSAASITCVVTATNPYGSTPATSNIITADNYIPVNTVAPVISGTMVVGQTLTTTNGTWTNSPTSFTYKWYKGITAIVGATSSTYILVQADAGTTTTIKCEVTAINLAGSTAADSNTLTTVYDADAQAFITAAVITVLVQMTAINELTIGLKADSLWTSMSALYPMVGGTATQHKYNLKNPLDTNAAFRLVFNGGWTHSSTGATPNGTNAYADTYYNPFNNLTNINSNHISFYSRTNASTTSIEMGGGVGAVLVDLELKYSALSYNWNMASFFTHTNANSTGMYVNTRTGATAFKLIKNSATILGTGTGAAGATKPNINYYIGKRNYDNLWSTKECAFASIGDGLSDADVSNFYTAVQTFQTTLGRQV